MESMATFGIRPLDKVHWCPYSETYATAEVLLAYLHSGWLLDSSYRVKAIWRGGYRRIAVYYFTLRQSETQVEIPVILNPVVSRVCRDYQLIRVDNEQPALILVVERETAQERKTLQLA